MVSSGGRGSGAAPVCGPVSSHGLHPEGAEISGHCSPPNRFRLQSPVPLRSLQFSFFSDRCFLSACSLASRLFLWYIFTPAKARQRIRVFAARIYSSRGTCSRTSREKDTCDCSRSHVSLCQPLSFCKCYWALQCFRARLGARATLASWVVTNHLTQPTAI